MTCSREKKSWNNYLVFLFYMMHFELYYALFLGKKYSGISDDRPLVGPRLLPDSPVLYGCHCCQNKDTCNFLSPPSGRYIALFCITNVNILNVGKQQPGRFTL